MPPLPGEHVASGDRGRTWCAAVSRDNVLPRSQTPGGGGNAGQATAPEAGEETTGTAAGHGAMDYLRGPGMWWFCFEAQVVPENAEGHRCCRRGMNCCCRGRCARAHLPCQDGGRAWVDRGVLDKTGCRVRDNLLIIHYRSSPFPRWLASYSINIRRLQLTQG